ncbi:hypothetical protein CJ307_23995 [Klebsiella quasipneumoniae]|nr:hypothetical protein CJ307_23995 [Klebsiella quasipneumoniae]
MLNNIKAIALLFNEIAAVVNYCILKVWPRRYNRARWTIFSLATNRSGHLLLATTGVSDVSNHTIPAAFCH